VWLATERRTYIHFVGENGISEAIHSLVNGNTSSVAVTCLVRIVSLKLHMLNVGWIVCTQGHAIRVQTAVFEHIADFDSPPFGSTHGSNHPVRSNEDFLTVVMKILTAISGTCIQSATNVGENRRKTCIERG
jgi:hypothetical protein